MTAAGAIRRRGLLPLLAAPVLAACGFHPVYEAGKQGAESAAAAGLAQVAVGLIPERSGQELRLALQERFERAGIVAAHRYDLTVTFAVSAEQIAIQSDSSSSFERLIGTANYRLTAQDANRTTLTTGTVRSEDGMNIFDQQFFALDQETEETTKRIAEAVADQIALQLAVFFNKRAKTATG